MTPGLAERLGIGTRPLVVGTIITADFLKQYQCQPTPLPCDLVELRLDGLQDCPCWLEGAETIETQGLPVFVTLRLQEEGGKWIRPDQERLPYLEAALDRLSGIDVELRSPLADTLGRRAKERGKICVVSFHDFTQTPPLPRLQEIVKQQQNAGTVAKIAATANTPEDLSDLRSLLQQHGPTPICVIGMGPLGRETRLQFPKEGSCFTYGYLDQPGAPGQYSAAELRQVFPAP